MPPEALTLTYNAAMWPRERITSPQNPNLRPYRLLAGSHLPP